MTSHDSFFQEKQPAAVLKHAVLAEYTGVFASMVGSRDRSLPIWVIDAYAGAGTYESPNPELENPDGSPLVVLKMAEKMASSRDIRCVFIEQRPGIAAVLRSNVAPFQASGRQVTVLEGSVESQLQAAWTLVNGGPVVTFLDPFGVAMDRHHMTDTLLAPRPGGQPSEVLLNINVEAVWRIGGNLQRGLSGFEPQRGQEKGVLKADAFLGGTWWREVFFESREAGQTAAQAAQAVVDEYCTQVCRASGGQSMSIPVRRRPESPPLFLLTLFFDHSAAGYKFADAACRATRKWRDAYRARELADFREKHPEESLFGDEFEVELSTREGEKQEKELDEEWVRRICSNVKRADNFRLPLAADLNTILGDVLGLAGERHIRLAWDRLASEGYLRPRNKSRSNSMYYMTMERA